MKINTQFKKDQNSIIIIQITSPKNPLILYLLELSEIEYQNIMKEQKILVNFEDFPNFLMKLLKSCSRESNQNFSAKLEISDSPEVIFSIEEKKKI